MQPRDGRAGVAQMEARLEAFRAYHELVRAQEAAVERGDIDEVRRLSDLRDSLQRRLDIGGDLDHDDEAAKALASGGPSEPDGPPQLTVSDGGVAEREKAEARAEEIRAETYRVLLDTAQAHQRMTERLTELRDEVGEDATGMGRRQSGIRSYVGPKSDTRSGINVRF